MADSFPTPVPNLARANGSALDPLREPLFRSLWFAAVISYTGTWMQNVGAGWLMTQLTTSPLKISLVQAASTLPVFLVILPAGALADMVDRRRFLLITQAWMVAAAGLLGIFTLFGYVTPWILLLFTFILGLGAVMNDPAWQALTPDIVCRENHAPAVALNSVGFNVARAVGPALGGLVIAATSSGIAFLMNAASFFGVIFFLYRWKRPSFEQAQTGRVLESMRAGFRFLRSDPLAQCVLIPNVASETMSPPRMRARALSMYLLVLQGGMALGSAAWGALATNVGVPTTMLCSAVTLILGLVTVRRYRLTARELELSPSVVRD